MPDTKDKLNKDSDGFIESLTELAESEEYGDVTKALLEEASDNVDVSPFEIKGLGGRRKTEEDDLKALFLEVQDHAAEVAVDESEYEDYDELPEINTETEPEAKKESSTEPPKTETRTFVNPAEKIPEVKADDREEFVVDVGNVFETVAVDDVEVDPDDIPIEPRVNLEKISESIISETETEAEPSDNDPPSLIAALKKKSDAGASNDKDSNGKGPEVKEPDSKEPEDKDKDVKENKIKSEEVPKKKKKKKKSAVYTLMMLICIGVFLYCVGRIGVYYYTHWEYKKSMKKLQNIVGDITKDKNPEEINPKVITVTDTDIYFPDELVYATETKKQTEIVDEVSDDWKKKYASLYEMNHDCVGWITIPDTQIDYPVMYTPGDYEKYLYKDFEGRYLFRGLPFMAENTLLNKSQNYIIYGHNMNDGTAFNNLRKFRDSKWIEDGHKYCYFNTAFAEGIYEVMAVVITKIYTVEDKCFKYYKYDGELTEDEFNTYVYYMKKLSSYKSDVEAYWGDQLLSLSTCYRVYDPEGRLVVVFKRVQ